jgi:hypothetical protein
MQIVRLAVDALQEAGPELRVLSASVVLFGAVAVGIPLGAVFLYRFTIAAPTDAFPDIPPEASLALLLALLVGVVALILLLVQIPLLVIATVGARLAGRPLTLREALRRSRQVFLRGLGGVISIGLLTAIPTGIAQEVITGVLGPTELALGLGLAAGAIFASPWVYVLPGIVLGGVGLSEALRRSWTIARLRWRIAVTIAALAVVGQFFVVSAAGSIADAIATVVFVAGNGRDVPTPAEPVVGIVLVALALIFGASLVFGVQLVQFAPQASGFFAMTGYTAGLDPARGGEPEPLFKRASLAFYVVGVLAAVYLIVSAIQVAEAG